MDIIPSALALDIDAGVIGVFIPIIALMIPVVAILVKHQQRMAEIIHGSQLQQGSDPQIAILQEEIRQLRQQVNILALERENKSQ